MVGMRYLYVLAGVLTATSACGGRSIREVGSGAVGEQLYVVNSGSVTVSAFGVDTSTGALSGVAGSPFPAAMGAFSAAVTPAFANLYVDTEDRRVTTFSVSRGTGALTLMGTSSAFGDVDMTMTALAADPTGAFLFAANCGSESVGSLSVFALDRQTGLASPTGLPEGTPFCPNGLAVDASGRFLYVSSQYAYNGDLEGFSIDAKSGALTPLEGSPFGSFMAVGIAIDPSGKHVYACDQDGWVQAYGVDVRTGALTELGARPATGGNPFSIVTDRTG